MNNKIAIFSIAAILLFAGFVTASAHYQTVENKNQITLPDQTGLMQRLMNQFRDTLGVCKGGVDLETLTGIMTYDGTNFFIATVEVHFGPIWYITSAMSAVDYDQDGELELIIDELNGLIDTEVTVEGHYQSDDWMSVFTINGEIYREAGSSIWASQHQWQWRYGHRNGQP